MFMKKIISGVSSFSLALFLAACGGAATQPPTGDSTAPGANSTAVGSTSGLESTPATSVDPMATSPAASTGDTSSGTTGTSATSTTGDTAGTSATSTTGDTAGTSATSTTGGTAGTSATSTTGGTTSGAVADLGELASDPRFTTLNGLLTTTGLDQQLATLGPFTLFAPTNEAFAALPAGTLEALSQNPSLLQEILLYHVANESIRSTDISASTTAETVAGEELTVSSSGGEVTINNSARVVEADISAGQGVIHAIDQVLLPPGVALGS
jgi:transforming growth factor-beta-induced protein